MSDPAAEGEPRCWWCGVRPYESHPVNTFGGRTVRLPPILLWPEGGDHVHEVDPPTPEQLLDRGYRALLRMIEILTEGDQ
ncbi:hypothetical protein [Micromonospora sp. NPDC005652]|uniref:hypothetical protein n=1 Tax=Micromonospora sp. NPDC005652 TaxID=3157046 RepID=UPI0033F6DDAA